MDKYTIAYILDFILLGIMLLGMICMLYTLFFTASDRPKRYFQRRHDKGFFGYIKNIL